ncbi:MAG TPA: DUF4386 domain-containing protein [Thermoanaerobaculia bacterium]|nr:DUF4386 domain-containing protein [Thermoanaerobaculia bacterium]
MHPTDKAARVAGAIYLSMVFLGPFSLMYVPRTLIVRGNATATAANILARETLFRFGIAADLIGMVVFILLALALYRLFSGVNKTHALALVALVLVSAAVGFLNVLNNIAALTLIRGADFLAVFQKPQRDALAMLFLRLYSQGIMINEIFWGLWLFPFGVLVMKSRFLPRILGVLLIVNGFAWMAVGLLSLLLPDYPSIVDQFARIAETGELWIMLWLLIKGAKVESLPAAVPEPI